MAYSNAWASLKDIPNIVEVLASFVGVLLTIAGSLSAALIGALVSRRTAKKTLAQGQTALAIQQLVTNRSTASFIAEKRQKWIDELRSDMAAHLAESQGIVHKWAAIRSTTATIREDPLLDTKARMQAMATAADEFSKSNGDLDRQHQERHIRIRLRLNPEEPDHIALRSLLDNIRVNITMVASAKIQQEGTPGEYVKSMQELVRQSEMRTQTILKTEWTRVKQEVAYPEQTLSKIPFPSSLHF